MTQLLLRAELLQNNIFFMGKQAYLSQVSVRIEDKKLRLKNFDRTGRGGIWWIKKE